jgi:maltose phosphorylase
MVTMNGEECHNEWEITFEEIHRNGAIAFAIYNYYRHTGDWHYIEAYGRHVLVGIARFWAQRVHWSAHRNAFVMLGVTGPNEYENNINNNWYTNYIAKWCLGYTLDVERKMDGQSLISDQETDLWKRIIAKLVLPAKEDSNVFLQQDGFLDKELVPVSELPQQERPINQHWSWDRILRSVYIKQADVLQGIYLFEEHFEEKVIRDNFDFYEPFTVHESSLSPCVHAIIAAKIGRIDKAYEFYLRTSRLDLDDYNNEVAEGLHITSMAGTWMSIVEGMAGIRVTERGLSINPVIPAVWKKYAFQFYYKNEPLHVEVGENTLTLENRGITTIELMVGTTQFTLAPSQKEQIKR